MKDAIEVQNVSKSIKGKQIIKDISFTIPKGIVCGLIGPNGAGKTTLINMMTGLSAITKGDILLEGKKIQQLETKDYEIFGAFISKPNYYGDLTAEENLKMIQKMIGAPLSNISEALRLVNLDDKEIAKRKVKYFSFGMKQRLGLAFAFLNSPDIIILDEPLNGLDPKNNYEIRELIYHLSREQEKTILISSHNITELELLVDSVCIINKGELLYTGTLDKLYEQNSTTYQLKVSLETVELTKKLLNANRRKFKLQHHVFEIEATQLEIPQLVAELSQQGVEIFEISPNKNLEKIFLDLTR